MVSHAHVVHLSIVMDSVSLQKLYTFTYDLQFSPCGNYLSCCDNFGFLSVFSLKSVLDPSAIVFGSNRSPLRRWKVSSFPLYCLESTNKLLLAGGEEGLFAWKWKDIKKFPGGTETCVEPLFTFVPPKQIKGHSDINSIAYDDKNGSLYVASGNSIHCLDLETRQIKDTYTEHKEYIHAVCVKPDSNQFLTGSEDGTIKLWDASNSKALQTLQQVDKKKEQHWIGCVSVDEAGEWMIYGGSCAPTLCKLGSMTVTSSFSVPVNVHTQSAIFTSGRIISGGSEGNVRHWARNGDSISCVPSSLSHVFSIKHNNVNPQHEILAVSGDSCEIDVFTHFGYKSFSLSTF